MATLLTSSPAARERFLAAVPAELRPAVAALLADPRRGGRGLRAWLNAVEVGAAVLPASMPAALVAVYLADPEAMPLHDCGFCGLAVPVRPDECDEPDDGEPRRLYFPTCPVCGGATGQYAHLRRELSARRPTRAAAPAALPSGGVA
jgi:hypothetical protein